MSEVKNGRYVDDEFGTILWYKNGLPHREDGPAYEDSDGAKAWLINGLRHNENGPAVISLSGEKQWWIHGNKLTEEEFNDYLSKKKINENLQLTLDNKAKKSRVKI